MIMRTRVRNLISRMIPVCLAVSVTSGFAAGRTLEWVHQFGTAGEDDVQSVTLDNQGNLFLAGNTRGALYGTSDGSPDAFLAKLNSDGTLLWGTQFASGSEDYGSRVAADGLGDVYLAGWTRGELQGTNNGFYDAYVRKYDSTGQELWTRQLGSTAHDNALGVTTDLFGNVVISGGTSGDLGGPHQGSPGYQDAFIAKLSGSGDTSWIQHLAFDLGSGFYDTSVETGKVVATDSLGNVFVTGQMDTLGTSQGSDGSYLAKFNAEGTLLWQQLRGGTGSRNDSFALVVDGAGNSYIAGYTARSFGEPLVGERDAFLTKYDPDGAHLWTKQFGTPSADEARAIALDANGAIFVAGVTRGAFVGTNQGQDDVFLAELDSDGTLQWVDQVGTASNDVPTGIAVDATGSVYTSGYTNGALGTAFGGNDAFLLKFSDLQLTSGDFDSDGDVDGRDFLIWQRQYGSEVTPYAGADGNGDGVVDAADFTVWRNNYGVGSSQSANSTAVPETKSLVLLGIAGAAVFVMRQR